MAQITFQRCAASISWALRRRAGPDSRIPGQQRTRGCKRARAPAVTATAIGPRVHRLLARATGASNWAGGFRAGGVGCRRAGQAGLAIVGLARESSVDLGRLSRGFAFYFTRWHVLWYRAS